MDELVRKRVRILHAESAQQRATLIRRAVAIRVRKKKDLRSLRDKRTIAMRQRTQRHHEPGGKRAHRRSRAMG
jgi:hypothetical protein